MGIGKYTADDSDAIAGASGLSRAGQRAYSDALRSILAREVHEVFGAPLFATKLAWGGLVHPTIASLVFVFTSLPY
jgi:hypothetical protein